LLYYTVTQPTFCFIWEMEETNETVIEEQVEVSSTQESDPVPSASENASEQTPKRKFIGKKGRLKPKSSLVKRSDNQGKVFRGRVSNIIPDDILHNEKLNQIVQQLLPTNYNFEIHKSIHRLRESDSKCVALQFPEGLLMYSGRISDILKQFCQVEVIVLGDVTYGACCVDDFTARALGADFLIHYGHSCLIPIDATEGVRCLYVFVDIKIDIRHFIDTVTLNFQPGQKLVLLGTIQFTSSLQSAIAELREKFEILLPQSKPLSPGEVLGCTSPRFEGYDALVYLADGRFHLESVMIHNPTIPAYKYDPYAKSFTREGYNTQEMFDIRKSAIDQASTAKVAKFYFIFNYYSLETYAKFECSILVLFWVLLVDREVLEYYNI
jgi:2-(3-amino-3-carboxypropyl)histidine synthase